MAGIPTNHGCVHLNAQCNGARPKVKRSAVARRMQTHFSHHVRGATLSHTTTRQERATQATARAHCRTRSHARAGTHTHPPNNARRRVGAATPRGHARRASGETATTSSAWGGGAFGCVSRFEAMRLVAGIKLCPCPRRCGARVQGEDAPCILILSIRASSMPEPVRRNPRFGRVPARPVPNYCTCPRCHHQTPCKASSKVASRRVALEHPMDSRSACPVLRGELRHSRDARASKKSDLPDWILKGNLERVSK